MRRAPLAAPALAALVAATAMVGQAALVPPPASADWHTTATSRYTVTPGPATVDSRGYYGRVTATVTDAGGNPVANTFVRFEAFPDRNGPGIFLCWTNTDANGVARCDDRGYNEGRVSGFPTRTPDVRPVTGDELLHAWGGTAHGYFEHYYEYWGFGPVEHVPGVRGAVL